jgi:hypothetical protein
VAIFIFSFSILGIIVISSHGVGDAQYAKNRLIASYLAQEGIELTRNVRDTTVINNLNNGWVDFGIMLATGGCDIFSGTIGCGLNYDLWMQAGNPFYQCGVLNDCLVYYNDSSGGKGYIQDFQTGYLSTKFTRIMQIQNISSDEIKIISEVFWTHGTSNTIYSVKAEENLFNWIL